MVKKSLKITRKSDNVKSSEAAEVETTAFTEEQPEAADERLPETETVEEQPVPEVRPESTLPEPVSETASEKPKVEAGERRGKGGVFISTGKGRVVRV